MELEYREMDQRIWEEELADWVPERVYDAHAHINDPKHCLMSADDPENPRPAWVDQWGLIDVGTLRKWDTALLPGRRTEYLLVASPYVKTDWEGQI